LSAGGDFSGAILY